MTRERGAFFAMLAAVLAAYIVPVLFGRTLVDDPLLLDISFNFMPNIHWMAESWRMGEFPLWNPHVVFGMPQLGYSHCGGLYPVTVVLFGLLDYISAGSATIIFHSLVASALMYWALRSIVKTPPTVSAAGGFIYVISGAFFGMSNEFWMLGSTCGFILFWVCMFRMVESGRFRYFAGAALGVAWSGLSGDTELLVYASMGVLVHVLMLSGPWLAARFRALVLFGGAFAWGGLVLMAMGLHLLVTVRYSIRGPLLPFEMHFITNPIPWYMALPTWALPFEYFGDMSTPFNFGYTALYQGFLVPWLVLWAILRGRGERGISALSVAWIFMFGYVLAREVPTLDQVIKHMPLIGDMHFTAKAMVVVHAFGIVLAMSSVFRIWEAGKRTEMLRLDLAAILFIAGLLMLVASPWTLGGWERYTVGSASVIGGVLLLIKRDNWTGRIARLALFLLVLEAICLFARHVPRTDPARFDLSPLMKETGTLLSHEDRYAIFEPLLKEDLTQPAQLFGLFELESGANNIVGPPRIPPARSFMYLDLFYGDLVREDEGRLIYNAWTMTTAATLKRDRMHLFNLAGPKIVLVREQALPFSSPYDLLKPNALIWRFSGKGPEAVDEGLQFSTPSRVSSPVSFVKGDVIEIGCENPSGFETELTVELNRPGLPENIIIERVIGPGESMSSDISVKGSGVANLVLEWKSREERARPVLTQLDIVNPERMFRLWGRSENDEVYLGWDRLPRAFIAREVIVMKDHTAVADFIKDGSRFNPAEQAVLEETGPMIDLVKRTAPLPPRLKAMEKTTITSYRSGRVDISIRAAAPGMLVLTDSYFPGWQAYVETGRRRLQTRINATDLAFRSIFVDQGEGRAVFEYRPVSFRVGLWMTISSLLFLLAASLIRALRRKAACAADKAAGQRR